MPGYPDGCGCGLLGRSLRLMFLFIQCESTFSLNQGKQCFNPPPKKWPNGHDSNCFVFFVFFLGLGKEFLILNGFIPFAGAMFEISLKVTCSYAHECCFAKMWLNNGKYDLNIYSEVLVCTLYAGLFPFLLSSPEARKDRSP